MGAGVDQAPAHLNGFVGGDPTRNPEDDAPAGERAQGNAYLIERSTSSGRS
jgi:hypothetical protein